MAKPAQRAYSRYVREALKFLGQLVRQERLERKMTLEELSERAGISRGLLQRIEAGDPACGIGAAFEVAALLDIRLFDLGREELSARSRDLWERLTLLPARARTSRRAVKDDF